MKLIAHRGNLNGPSKDENKPSHIVDALSRFYDVEIDVWRIGDQFFLGHDQPVYPVSQDFLLQPGLWCHAKNLEALQAMKLLDVEHYFWHETDERTLTSSGYFWTYPGKDMSTDSIFVMPETVIDMDDFVLNRNIAGYCSDYVQLINEIRIR